MAPGMVQGGRDWPGLRQCNREPEVGLGSRDGTGRLRLKLDLACVPPVSSTTCTHQALVIDSFPQREGGTLSDMTHCGERTLAH